MSKKLNTSQSNTLFNYFQSPKGKSATNGQSTNGKAEKKKKPQPQSESDEEPEIQAKSSKKRSRIIESDSENESPNKVVKTPNKTKPSSKAKKRKIVSESSDSSSEEETTTRKSLKTTFSFSKSTPKSDKTAPQEGSSHSLQPSVGTTVSNQHSNWTHNRLDFLKPDKIRDINKNKPDHPDYDSKTLHVPESFLNSQTPAMRQWWILKSTHMDTVLFFKVGKFYELYHMDAVIGVKHLGFSYMRGEFAHSGFPESAYAKMAQSLIEQGFKVARVEQTETPEMMGERCKQGRSTKFDKVVRREICQITTKATRIYNAQVPEATNYIPVYLYALCEKTEGNNTRFGACFIDTSIGTFHLAEFDDDKYCSCLMAMFSEHPPALILTERGSLNQKLNGIFKTHLSDVSRDSLSPKSQFYSASTTLEKLSTSSYFLNEKGQFAWPEFFKKVAEDCVPKPEYELALKCLGACTWYLKDSEIDIQIISMGKFEIYRPLDLTNIEVEAERDYMILDSVTIKNLDLLGAKGTLQKTVDFCETAFGKRLLQQWICRPLCKLEHIKGRQQAVQELYDNPNMLKGAQEILKKLPDLERQVAKIHAYGNKLASKVHPDSRAIFYEAKTYSKRKIADFIKTLKGFERAQEIAEIFEGCESFILKKITQFEPHGNYINLQSTLTFFKQAFDHEEAEKEGKITPKAGVDEEYDEIERTIASIKQQLDDYLQEQTRFFGCKITYFGSDKKRFQLDVPESKTHKVNDSYQLEGSRKNVSKRYSTPKSRQLLQTMIKAETERSKIIQDLNRRIYDKFSLRHEEWDQIIHCLAILDVLCSLARYALNYSQDVCLPVLGPFDKNKCKIVIENGRHPCVTNVDNFVPNDTKMGVSDYPSLLLLTGPNMGGKSTLMRQVALIAIMAQMGGFVPASLCELNLVDRIFTRLGAHDDIIGGQSTFFVELSEASAILQHATPNSLVLLDELGRGTSTHDGNAIATSYVSKLAQMNCRAMFSTHYHSLVDQFINRRDIQLGHMACMVENDDDPTEENVTFLYKMAQGRCPKSYGFSVARLAGMPVSVVSRGREVAKNFEKIAYNRSCFKQIFASLANVSQLRELLESYTI